MRISHNIRDFFGFAMLAVFGACGLWICWRMTNNPFALLMYFAPFCVTAALFSIGILGMVLSLVEGIISSVIAWRRAKASKRES